MIFHSFTFLFYFLPIALVAHRLTLTGVTTHYSNLSRVCLLLLTAVFYGWDNPWWLIPFGVGVGFDFVWAICLGRSNSTRSKRIILGFSLFQNFCLLGAFKYWDPSVVAGIHQFPILGKYIGPHGLAMPAGISFYTFESLSYVIDVYRGKVAPEKNPLNFLSFMGMFPRFIAGPIVRYNDLAPQFDTYRGPRFPSGMTVFIKGLFFKLCFADNFSIFANYAFKPSSVDFLSAWIGILAYTMQLYFDFWGYSLMAVGLGKCLGFEFPENFKAPYSATSAKDFWSRWHITLSNWFRDYVYVSLGGNRRGPLRTYFNLLVTMTLAGIWHGANLTFVLWGLWHGVILCLERAFRQSGFDIPSSAVKRILTMTSWVLSLTLFNSATVAQGFSLLTSLVKPFAGTLLFSPERIIRNPAAILFCAWGVFYCFFVPPKPVEERRGLFVLSLRSQLVAAGRLFLVLVFGFTQTTVPFLYFQF